VRECWEWNKSDWNRIERDRKGEGREQGREGNRKGQKKQGREMNENS
jgi:hypothetical protein